MSSKTKRSAGQARLNQSSWVVNVDTVLIQQQQYELLILYGIKEQQYLGFSIKNQLAVVDIYNFLNQYLCVNEVPDVIYFADICYPDVLLNKDLIAVDCAPLPSLDNEQALKSAISLSTILYRYKFQSTDELTFFLQDFRLQKNRLTDTPYTSELQMGVTQLTNKNISPDICLIHLLNWFSDSRLDNDLFAPIGSAYIHAALEAIGYSVQTLLYRHDSSQKTIPLALKKSSPKVIGISSTGHEINELKNLSISLKSFFEDVPIIVGGYCSLDASNLFKDSAIDVVVVGEGELTVSELVPLLLAGKSLEKVSGIVYRTKDGQIRANPPRRNIDELDILPMPSYQTYPKSSDICVVTASRGCPYTCTYCEVKDFYTTHKIRHHSPKYIKNLLTTFRAENPNFNHVFFYDDEFLLYAEHLSGLGSVLKELNMQLTFQTRVRDIISHQSVVRDNKDLIRQIQLGVESFSQSQLDRWKKKTQVSHNYEALEILSRMKVPYTPLIILTDSHTTQVELEENCEGILQMPESSWWGTNESGKRTMIQIKPFRRPLRLNRLLDFYGAVERSENTTYLESVWLFLKSSHNDFCDLSKIYMCELAASKPGNRDLTEEISSLLDERIRRIPQIAAHASKLNTADKIIEFGMDQAEDYRRKLKTLSFKWFAAQKSKALVNNTEDNYS